MKKRSSKEPSEFAKLFQWVDGLITFGFAAGVVIIVGLFIYVLVTQFSGTSP